MTGFATAGTDRPVTLDAVLEGREMRAQRQAQALARHGLPVASVSLVMPGPVKDSLLARYLLGAAVAALDALMRERSWEVLSREQHLPATGPEALYVIDAEARSLKAAVARLEDTHPLGRLWDVDVLAPREGPLSRVALGMPTRGCLLCDQPGHACARSRRHALPELMRVIQEKVDAFRTSGIR
jgi:holo-ACP synthase